MQTIGSIVDQLIVVDLKIWHKLDKQYIAKTHEEKSKAAMDVAHLNEQRNILIDEVDYYINKAIKEGEAPVFNKHKSYGEE